MCDLKPVCGVCFARISPGAGVLWADMAEVNDRLRDTAEPRAGWRVNHHVCAGVLDARTYAIDIGYGADARWLLWWTAHLGDKTWLPATDWLSVVRTAGESGRLEGRAGLPSAPAPEGDPQ